MTKATSIVEIFILCFISSILSFMFIIAINDYNAFNRYKVAVGHTFDWKGNRITVVGMHDTTDYTILIHGKAQADEPIQVTADGASVFEAYSATIDTEKK